MLTIRLARRGKRNAPFFRVVISEKARDTFGRALEILGSYDPKGVGKTATLNAERIQYWISKGAQPSPTVHNLLIKQKVITGDILKSSSVAKKKK